MIIAYKFFTSILAMFLLRYFTEALFKIETPKNVNRNLVLVGLVLGAIYNFHSVIGTSIKAVLVLIITILTVRFILGLKLLYSIIVPILFSLSQAIGDIIAMYIMVNLYGFQLQQIKQQLSLLVASELIIYGVQVLAILIIKMFTQSKEVPNRYRRGLNLRISIYMLVTFLIVAINHSIYIRFINMINPIFIFLNIVVLLIYFIFSLSINFTTGDLIIKEYEYEQQENYIRTIDRLMHDFRRMKHNQANILYSINGYVQKQDIVGLKEYFNTVLEENQRISEDALLSLQKIKIYPLFGLLWSKVSNAESVGLKVAIQCSDEVFDVHMGLKDLCEILGNFLDNAIDAARASEDKQITISIYQDKQYLIICISNSFDYEIDLGKINMAGYSTKGENRGYGLSIVKELLSNYKHILHNTTIKENKFIQELMIKRD